MYKFYITDELLEDLVNDIENRVVDQLFDIGEYRESNEYSVKEVKETRDEILFALVAKIMFKYLNKYTQD